MKVGTTLLKKFLCKFPTLLIDPYKLEVSIFGTKKYHTQLTPLKG